MLRESHPGFPQDGLFDYYSVSDSASVKGLRDSSGLFFKPVASFNLHKLVVNPKEKESGGPKSHKIRERRVFAPEKIQSQRNRHTSDRKVQECNGRDLSRLSLDHFRHFAFFDFSAWDELFHLLGGASQNICHG